MLVFPTPRFFLRDNIKHQRHFFQKTMATSAPSLREQIANLRMAVDSSPKPTMPPQFHLPPGVTNFPGAMPPQNVYMPEAQGQGCGLDGLSNVLKKYGKYIVFFLVVLVAGYFYLKRKKSTAMAASGGHLNTGRGGLNQFPRGPPMLPPTSQQPASDTQPQPLNRDPNFTPL
jgi:hypothetical protein